MLGSADFLGNPVGLFNNIGTGFADFFYEPAAGLIQSPEAFGKGLAKVHCAYQQFLIMLGLCQFGQAHHLWAV